MSVFEFAIAVVAIVFGTKLIRDIVAGRRRRSAVCGVEAPEVEESSTDKKRIAELEDRIRTLERIMTDPSSNLAREIDGL